MADQCVAITQAKRRCQHKPYATTSSYGRLQAGVALSAATHCVHHLPRVEKGLIAEADQAREAAYERAIDFEPACWSWPVTDEVRDLIAEYHAHKDGPDWTAGLRKLFAALDAFTGDRCAICNRPNASVMDHDHRTGNGGATCVGRATHGKARTRVARRTCGPTTGRRTPTRCCGSGSHTPDTGGRTASRPGRTPGPRR